MRWAGATGDACSKLFDVARRSRKKRQINIDAQFYFLKLDAAEILYISFYRMIYSIKANRARGIRGVPSCFAMTRCVSVTRRTRGLRRGCAR
jgi:hypothetical protein